MTNNMYSDICGNGKFTGKIGRDRNNFKRSDASCEPRPRASEVALSGDTDARTAKTAPRIERRDAESSMKKIALLFCALMSLSFAAVVIALIFDSPIAGAILGLALVAAISSCGASLSRAAKKVAADGEAKSRQSDSKE